MGKNVTLNLDVDEIYTKTVKKESNKGGKIYVHKDLIGKKVIVLSLKNGKKVNKIKKRKLGKYVCKRCKLPLKISIPPYQREGMKFCECDDPDI